VCQRSWNSVGQQALFSSSHWVHIFSTLKNIGFNSLYYLFFLYYAQPLCFVYHPCTTQTGICICCLELITSTDSSKHETVQRKFVALFYSRDFLCVCCNYYEVISTLYSRRRHLHALFLTNVFKSIISCSFIIDSVSVRIPNRISSDYIYG
jgi:hypothetical protein